MFHGFCRADFVWHTFAKKQLKIMITMTIMTTIMITIMITIAQPSPVEGFPPLAVGGLSPAQPTIVITIAHSFLLGFENCANKQKSVWGLRSGVILNL